MPIDRDRQRAKRRYQRRQAKLAAKAVRTRRTQQIVGAVLAVLLVSAGVVALTQFTGDETSPAASGGAAPSTSATSSAPSAASSTPPDASPSPSRRPAATYDAPPPTSLAAQRTWQVTVRTTAGTIGLELDGKAAPQTVASFLFLSQKKFYNGTTCHRLTTQGIFVLQCGDPAGDGTGGPGYTYGIENAPRDGSYPAGTLAMARGNDPSSNGSQFFMVYKATTLPTDGGGYSIFGRVVTGLDVLEKVAAAGTADGSGDGSPRAPVTVTGITVKQK
ncbi:MAG: peptidylprolyl isomerase [Angustibacter sp.]